MIHVDIDSPKLGFPPFDFLGGPILRKTSSPITGIENCEGQACLDPYNKTIIVREGQTIEIKLASKGIYPCDGGTCGSGNSAPIRATDVQGCYLKFSRETSRMTRDDLLPSDCKNTRDSSWAATANDFQSSDDVYLKIESAHPVDR